MKFSTLLVATGLLSGASYAANVNFDYNADIRVEEAAVNLLLRREMPKSYDLLPIPTDLGPIGIRVNRIGVDFQTNMFVLDVNADIYAGNNFIKNFDQKIPVDVAYISTEVINGQLISRIDGALDRLARFINGTDMSGFAPAGRIEEAALRAEGALKSVFNRVIIAQLKSPVGVANKFLLASKQRLLDYPIFASNGRVSAIVDNAMKVNVKYRIDVEDPIVTAQFDPITGNVEFLGNCAFSLQAVFITAGWLGILGELPHDPSDPSWKYGNDAKAWWDASRQKYVIRRAWADDLVFYFQWLWWNNKYSAPTMPYRADLAGKQIALTVLANVNGKQFGPFNYTVKL